MMSLIMLFIFLQNKYSHYNITELNKEDVCVTQLIPHCVCKSNVNNHFNGNNVFYMFSQMSFVEVEEFVTSKKNKSKESLFLKFNDYVYLDELFLDESLRPEFENFVFNLIEGREKRFIYLSFQIKETNFEKLIHNGFYEWLEYWMLFVKFTHINFTFEMVDNSFSELLPLTYQIVKRLENPRATIFMNTQSKTLCIPEDVNLFTIVVNGDADEIVKKYPYAIFSIN